MGEFEGAVVTEFFQEIEGQLIFQCYKVVLPTGQIRMVPKVEENADFQRIKIWNATNGNPLGLE